jgi:elongation factor P--(R)-beta-lysine ligase
VGNDPIAVSGHDWEPTASHARLQARARLLQQCRRFFQDRGVLEVETPLAVQHAVTDVHLHSALVQIPGLTARFLHTSPEFSMKRLLAAGSGDIYQICHVFRGHEQGPLHHSEFTLLEWYRLGFSMQQLMDEVALLLQVVLGAAASQPRFITYSQAMQAGVGCDPLSASDADIAGCAQQHGFEPSLVQRCDRDQLLDLLMGARVGPSLGRDAPCFVHHFPASQAALARLDAGDPRTALRFEVYMAGVELANGFEELGAAGEQRARFEGDLRQRRALGIEVPSLDERLLAALAHGLPACSGVAIGLDRLLMLATGADQIRDVLAFTHDNA